MARRPGLTKLPVRKTRVTSATAPEPPPNTITESKSLNPNLEQVIPESEAFPLPWGTSGKGAPQSLPRLSVMLGDLDLRLAPSCQDSQPSVRGLAGRKNPRLNFVGPCIKLPNHAVLANSLLAKRNFTELNVEHEPKLWQPMLTSSLHIGLYNPCVEPQVETQRAPLLWLPWCLGYFHDVLLWEFLFHTLRPNTNHMNPAAAGLQLSAAAF